MAQSSETKWGQASTAYRNGTTGDLPVTNPYRHLVQTHDANYWTHRGLQGNCPACMGTAGPKP